MYNIETMLDYCYNVLGNQLYRLELAMRAYTGFANVYDKFMDNVPYDTWSEYLISLLKEYGVEDGLVLELGCGTGSITRRLASQGYDMIGIDNSEDMLEIAREKEMDFLMESMEDMDEEELESEVDGEYVPRILYLEQDMREFELFGTVRAVVSICDSMNYITKEEDLIKVFKLVNNYLDAGGLFIFDLNTVYKYKTILGDTTIAENREDCSFIWENFYHEDEMMNEYDVTIYKKVDAEDDMDSSGLYERFEETHYQKAYELETIISLLEKAGMEYVTAYDACTKDAPKEDSERIYVIAREKKQANKFYTEM